MPSTTGRDSAAERRVRALGRVLLSAAPPAARYGRAAQAGLSVLEVVVATALLTLASVAFLGALSSALAVGARVEQTSVAASQATAQLETAIAQAYVEPPDYPTVTPPTTYAVAPDNLVLSPTLEQRIGVTVSVDGRALFSVSTHKVNTAFVASPPSLLLAQRDFRWYQDSPLSAPDVPLAAENTPYTVRRLGQAYRLRMSVQIDRLPLGAGASAFKLQYAADPGGPWVDVGAPGSAAPWRFDDVAGLTDSATLSSAVLSGSHVPQSYEEDNPSRLNPNAVGLGEWAEWDWAIEENGASFSTNYYFRMALSDGAPLGTYTRFPSIVMPPPLALTQADYRWFANADSPTPGPPLTTVRTPYSAPSHGLVYRLRLGVLVDGLDVQAGVESFKLQFATSPAGPWTDVGDASSGVEWRGYDNPSLADGTAVSSFLLPGSVVAGSYEEANPAAPNLAVIAVGQRAEWDWAVQDNGAAATTTYYFRMTYADGAPLDAYAFYPVLTTPPPLTLAQQDYRWYANLDGVTPATSAAPENTAASDVGQPDVLRLRVNVDVGGADVAAEGQALRLQYATDAGGPWTDVGPAGDWRGYDNPTAAHGAEVTPLLGSSTVGVAYQEANPSALNPAPLTAGARAEWDWAIQHNGAAPAATYSFRLVREDGAPLDSYVRYPTVVTAPRTLAQADYRWFANADSVAPGPADAVENAALGVSSPLALHRLRMNVHVDGRFLDAGGQQFKLQFATDTDGPWTDVGAPGSGALWRGYDNPSPADGAPLAPLLATSDVGQSYEESSPSAPPPAAVESGQRAEWDWAVQNNGAPAGTYSFRMVLADGTPLTSYLHYPEVTAQAPGLTQEDYQWRANADGLVPGAALASENAAYAGATPLAVVRLRMSVGVAGAALPAGAMSFKLQYATSPAGPWTDVGNLGSGAAWRGYDNPSPADGAPIAALLTTSTGGQSYEESNPSALNPNASSPGQRVEWDWVLQNRAAPAGTYYFRMVRADGAPLDAYTRFPQIVAAAPSFAQDTYQWRRNADDVVPGAAYAAENGAVVSTADGLVYRLRLNVAVSGLALPAGAQAFVLQYATDAGGPWADVGAPGSAALWRGHDNPTPPDEAALTTLLTTSDVAATYEEAPPSSLNPGDVAPGQRAEWDWAVEPNGAVPATTYYFRLVREDGSPLDSYLRYPTLTTPPPLTFAQDAYGWFANADAVTPGAALAAENAEIGDGVPQAVYRLRINVQVSGADLLAGRRAFALQYATSEGGPWTDVGPPGSAAVWRAYDNPSPADGASLTPLLATSDVGQSYEEAGPSALNPAAVADGQRAEWDWALQDNGSPSATTFYFRMIDADGLPLDAYVRYPRLTTAPLTYAQDVYRWYDNRDNDTPNVPLAAENAAYTAVAPGRVYRLRVDLQVGGADLPAGAQAFTLQYATSEAGPWADVGAIGSLAAWRGFDNPAVPDGNAVNPTTLSASDVGGSYEEENPSVLNPNAVSAGQRGEWEWVLQDNAAAPDTLYYFRVVRSDGAPLDAYVRYPALTTAPPQTFTQDTYRWYQNRDNRTPDTPLAAEDAALADAAPPTVFRLRVNVLVQGVDLPADARAFTLQYATSEAGPWTDVGAPASAEAWRGFDNGGTADGTQLTTSFLLSDTDRRATYEEENPSLANPQPVLAGERVEYDWVVQANAPLPETAYYFRMVFDGGAPLDSYVRYPRITTAPPVLARDDFESGGASGGTGWLGAWDFQGDAQVVSVQSPYEGGFHLRLRRGTGYAARQIDLSGRASVSIQFHAKARNWDPGESASFLVSSDGVSFTTVHTWVDGVDDDDAYHFFEFDLTPYGLSSAFFIAFDADMAQPNDHFYIDDIRLVGG